MMTMRGPRLALAWLALAAMGAGYETPNFLVVAPTPEMARQIGLAAEQYRRDLATEWLGAELPRWSEPCRVSVRPERPDAGGFTTFIFCNGTVRDWDMIVEGPFEQIVESVLPHEISHTIFASHFGHPVPRWADEGASLLAESETERARQRQFATDLLRDGRGMPLRQLFTLGQYPRDQRQVLALYAQGHSLAEFLVRSAGRPQYVAFLESAGRNGWDWAIHRHYGFESVEDLEGRFRAWMRADRPLLVIPPGQLLVNAQIPASPPPQMTAGL